MVSLPDDPESSFLDTYERFCCFFGYQLGYVLIHPLDYYIFAAGESGTGYWRLGDKHGALFRPAGVLYACFCSDWGTWRTGEALVMVLAFGKNLLNVQYITFLNIDSEKLQRKLTYMASPSKSSAFRNTLLEVFSDHSVKPPSLVAVRNSTGGNPRSWIDLASVSCRIVTQSPSPLIYPHAPGFISLDRVFGQMGWPSWEYRKLSAYTLFSCWRPIWAIDRWLSDWKVG